MPFHPRYVVLGSLGLFGCAGLVFAVAAGAPLGPAIAGGLIAGAGCPFYPCASPTSR